MKRPLSLTLSFVTPLFLLFLVWSAFAHIERVAAQPIEPADTRGGDATLDGQQNQSHVMVMASEVITAHDDTYETDEDVPLFVSASGVLTNDVNSVSGTLSALLVMPPAFGDAYLNLDGSFTYLPPLNFNGATTFTYQAAILEDFADMVAYWTLDDLPSSTVYDYSGHGHLGTLANGAAWVMDPAVTTFPNPYALYVDGIDDYVTIPDDAALDFGANDDFTVALWVKMGATQPDISNSDNSIVEKWSSSGGYPFVIRYLNQTAGADNGKIQVVRYDGTHVPYMNSNATVNDNQFHHVAFVKNGGMLELYIDGVLDNSIPDTTTSNPANNSPLFLGQRGGGTNKFQGTLDDLRIYDRSLSLAEVAQLAQGNHLGELSNTAVVTITVNPVNDAPVAVTDVYTATKYTTLNLDAPGVLANDSDLEGDAFDAVLLTPPLSGTLNLQPDGSFNYTPDITSSSYQSFTYAAVENTAVAYWPIDYTNPTPDMSGNGHPGTIVGNLYPGLSSPVSAETLYFALTNYLQAGGDEADFDLNILSIGFWIRIDSFAYPWAGIVTKGDSAWRVERYASTDYISFSTNGLSNVNLVSTQALNDGQWHHMAFVYDGSAKYIYIDGVLDVSAPATGTISQNNWPVMVGYNAEVSGRYLWAMMDDIYILNKPLSATEVMDMKAGLGVPQLSSNPTTVGLNILTPLVVNNLSPAANSHTAPLTTTLSAGFTIPIEPTSVTSQSLTVHGNMSGLTGVITPTAAGITYDPDRPFFPGELVESTILTNVLDTNGDPLLFPYVWRFQTGAGVGPAVFADNGYDFGDRWTHSSALADVDQDDDLDIVELTFYGTFIWPNDGNGHFAYGDYYDLGSNAQSFALGDLDGDSDLDMVVAKFNQPDQVWFNNGGLQGGTVGEFTNSGQQLGWDLSWEVNLGDVDNDGDLDALIRNSASTKVWLNDGSGTLTHSGYDFGSIGTSALGDVDGDGDLDVFEVVYAAPNHVWLNDGTGIFSNSGQQMGTGYSTGVALGDLDGDGDLDAFVSNIASPSNSEVWWNNGSGVFTDSGQVLPVGYGVALGDVDGDGDLDAFVTDTGPDKVLFNNGNGQFSDSGQSLGNTQSQDVDLGDVDGDGDLDAFVSTIHQDKLWLNELSASLTLQKNASSSTITPGEMITYTLTYANGGPHTATNVTITDDLPASIDPATLNVISSGAQITPVIGSTYVWQVADLALGDSGIITITGVISNPLVAGPFSNQATITTDLFESDTSDNVSTVTTYVAEVPPVAQDDVYTTTENISLTVSAASGVMQNDYDLNGSALTAVLNTAPVTGSLQFNFDGSFVYTPSLNFNGPVTFAYQLAAAENPDLMAGYWAMDDNALTAADSSGHGRTAWLLDGYTYLTDPTSHWTTDTAATSYPNPYALVFDGMDDWGIIATHPSFNFGPDDDFSVAFWIKAGTTQTDVSTLDNMLVSKWSSTDNTAVFAITLLNQSSGVRDGRILVSRSDGSNTPFIESVATVNDNQYHHVAFVKNGELLSLYIDGVVDGTTTDTTTAPWIYAYYYGVLLGRRADNTRNFQGALDDLRIYGHGLSATEVTQLAMGNPAIQLSQTAEVTITVENVNDAPTATADSYDAIEDTPLNISAPGVLTNDTDPDGDTLTAVLDTTTLSGTLTLNSNGSFSYTPDPDYCGTDNFTYHNYDGQTASNTVAVTLNITCTNDPPVANDDAATTNEDTSIAIPALSNDTDMNGDPLTITAVSTPSNGSVIHNSTTITYTPINLSADYTAVFTYTVSDGSLTDSATVTITITADNEAPVASDDSYTVSEDTSNTTFAVMTNDNDSDSDDTLSLSAVSTPDQDGTAVINGANIQYTPASNFVGIETFTYTIEDEGGLAVTATVTVTITNVNDAPTAVDDSYTVNEDTNNNSLNVLVNDSDIDTGDVLSISAVGTPANGTAVISGSNILYTPSANFSGMETFTYTIQDLVGLTDTATVTITVENVNDAPTAEDDSYTVSENSTDNIFTLLDNDTDIDPGDSLSITEVSIPTNGTAVISGTTILYTPATGFTGVNTFAYTIEDLGGLPGTATVTVTVDGVNNTPTAVDDNYTVDENSSNNVFDVLTNDSDIDGDSLSIVSIEGVGNGTTVISGTTILYTPASGFFGTDTFTYTISDGVLMGTATITVSIIPMQTGFTIYLPVIIKP